MISYFPDRIGKRTLSEEEVESKATGALLRIIDVTGTGGLTSATPSFRSNASFFLASKTSAFFASCLSMTTQPVPASTNIDTLAIELPEESVRTFAPLRYSVLSMTLPLTSKSVRFKCSVTSAETGVAMAAQITAGAMQRMTVMGKAPAERREHWGNAVGIFTATWRRQTI